MAGEMPGEERDSMGDDDQCPLQLLQTRHVTNMRFELTTHTGGAYTVDGTKDAVIHERLTSRQI